MRNSTNLTLVLLTVSISFFCSFQKQIDKQTDATATNTSKCNGVVPYKFERINEHNFSSQGSVEQQITNVSGANIFSDQSDYVEIVCGPENNTDPRLIQSAVTMNLPTSEYSQRADDGLAFFITGVLTAVKGIKDGCLWWASCFMFRLTIRLKKKFKPELSRTAKRTLF